MGTDSRGSGGGESAPGPAADPGEWLTASVCVCDSQCGCEGRDREGGGVRPGLGLGSQEPGALSLRAGDAHIVRVDPFSQPLNPAHLFQSLLRSHAQKYCFTSSRGSLAQAG